MLIYKGFSGKILSKGGTVIMSSDSGSRSTQYIVFFIKNVTVSVRL